MAINIINILPVFAAIAVLGACSSPTLDTQAPERLVSAGEHQAERKCGECHAIRPDGRSALADAPPFRDMRTRYSRLDMDALLRERMVEIHPRMPVLNFEPDELNTFLDYWESLAPAR